MHYAVGALCVNRAVRATTQYTTNCTEAAYCVLCVRAVSILSRGSHNVQQDLKFT